MSHTTRKLRHLYDEGGVIVVPVDDEFVFMHRVCLRIDTLLEQLDSGELDMASYCFRPVGC